LGDSLTFGYTTRSYTEPGNDRCINFSKIVADPMYSSLIVLGSVWG